MLFLKAISKFVFRHVKEKWQESTEYQAVCVGKTQINTCLSTPINCKHDITLVIWV